MNIVDRDVDEERIRGYLLRDLPEEEQTRLELEFLGDDRLFERVRAAEDDLIDDYVSGALSDQAHRQFETNFLTSPQRRRRVELARALQETVFEAARPPRPERVAVLQPIRARSGFKPSPRQLALVAASLLLVLSIVGWEAARYRRLERQFAALSASVDTLKKQNESLREMTADRLAQLDRASALLTQVGAQQTGPVALQDTSGPVTLSSDRTVVVAAQPTLPPAVSQWVRALMTTGTVTPVDRALPALAALRGDVTRHARQTGLAPATLAPAPVSPVLTAIRSSRPTLRWKAIPEAREYKVIVADQGDKVAWQSGAGNQTEVTLPPGVLRPGRVYFWQVEALVGAESRLSPTVGFWLLDEPLLGDVDNAEGIYATSALVLASVYAAHGLYEEALTQVERLVQLNPKSRQVQSMRSSLRRQLGRE